MPPFGSSFLDKIVKIPGLQVWLVSTRSAMLIVSKQFCHSLFVGTLISMIDCVKMESGYVVFYQSDQHLKCFRLPCHFIMGLIKIK